MKEKDILFWHLMELSKKSIFDIAEDLGYRPNYIDNVRTGRKRISDSFRFRVAKRYPALSEFMLRGTPPRLPKNRALFVILWYASGDNLQTIAYRTGYKVGYLRQMFNGSISASNDFKRKAIEVYHRELLEKGAKFDFTEY